MYGLECKFIRPSICLNLDLHEYFVQKSVTSLNLLISHTIGLHLESGFITDGFMIMIIWSMHFVEIRIFKSRIT